MKLTPEAKKIYTEIAEEYGISDSGGKVILTIALEAFMRMREAQKAIKDLGLIVKDSSNRPKQNPACQVERDSRSQILQSFKLLKLDITLS